MRFKINTTDESLYGNPLVYNPEAHQSEALLSFNANFRMNGIKAREVLGVY